MDQVGQEFGKPSPNAPAALSRFAFLIGRWRCEAKPEELGGVRLDGQSIVYAFKEPVAAHAYTRATYTNISQTHFTWRGEKSDDGKAWSEFIVVEAYRDSLNVLFPY